MKRDPNDLIRWMSPNDVGNMVGFTAQFIRNEIRAGEIPALLVMSKRGKLGRYRIKADDARAYVSRLHGASS